MILVLKFTAVLVGFAKFKMIQLSAFASLNVLKKTIHAEKSAQTAMKPGAVIVKFIANVVFATQKMTAVPMSRTRTSTSTTTENARNCR